MIVCDEDNGPDEKSKHGEIFEKVEVQQVGDEMACRGSERSSLASKDN